MIERGRVADHDLAVVDSSYHGGALIPERVSHCDGLGRTRPKLRNTSDCNTSELRLVLS